jgi:Tfp pilus assembly protein PilV
MLIQFYRKQSFTKSELGFTLAEVLASLAILLIGILALLSLFPQGMKAAKVAEDKTVAAFLAQQKAEDIKRQEFLWSAGTTAGPIPFPLEPNFRWQASVVAAGGTDRLVTVTILWRDRDYSVQTKI